MAIIPSELYPGQTETGDANYPGGKAQNLVVEGDGSGWPLEKTWINDLLGWQQALLAAAGIEASGDEDHVNESQYTQAIQLLAERSHSSTNVQSVGVIGNGLADDTAAIVAAQSAVVAAGGGSLFFPPGRYRITSAITRSPLVAWLGVPGLSVIAMNHATEGTLVFSGTYDAPVLTYGLDFEADQNNTGIVIAAPTGTPKAIFQRCRVNHADNKLKGKLFYGEGEETFVFEDCEMLSQITTAVALASDFGRLTLRRGHYTMAPASTQDMMYGDEFTAEGTTFVHNATIGNVAFIAMAGSDDFRTHVHDCVFDSTAGAGTFAVKLVGNLSLHFLGNRILSPALLYKVVSAPLADGSDIQLIPHRAYSISAATVLLAQGYKTHAIVSDDGSPPTVTLAAPLIKGQRVTVAVRNISGGAWTGAIGFTSSVSVAYTEAGGLTDLADDEIATINFEAITLDTGLAWVQIGDAAQHFLAS